MIPLACVIADNVDSLALAVLASEKLDCGLLLKLQGMNKPLWVALPNHDRIDEALVPATSTSMVDRAFDDEVPAERASDRAFDASTVKRKKL